MLRCAQYVGMENAGNNLGRIMIQRLKSTYRNCSQFRYLNNPSNWRMTGTSIAGVATSLFLMEPRIMVDAGALLKNRKTPIIPSDLLITHHHGDHNRNIGYYAELKGKKSVNIVDPVTDYHHGLGGRTYELTNEVHVKTIELDHTIKSIGYGLTSKDGTKEVAMMGDTRIDPLYKIPEILEYPVIVIECTNYNPSPNKINMYRRYGHLSWAEIKDVIINNRDIFFHLIHPSSMMTFKKKYWIQKNLIEGAGITNARIWMA